MRWWIGVAVIALGLGCGDDGGASTASTTQPTDTTSPPTSSTTTQGSTSSGAGSESTVSSVDESSGSSGGSGVVILQNDQWEDGEQLGFQMGFAQGECWASTYVPESDSYPLTVDAAQMVVGGDDEGTGNFEVSVWSVDADNKPDQMMGSGTVQVSGVNSELDVVLFDPLFERPVFESGNFAIAVCFVDHTGFPAIARDDDGTISDDLNWIFAGGDWVQSSSLGLMGDWIMRASVVVG